MTFRLISKYRARRTRKEEQGDNKKDEESVEKSSVGQKDLDITRKSEFIGGKAA